VRGQRLEPGVRVPLMRGEPFRLGAALLVIHAVEEDAPVKPPSSEEEATRRDDGTGTSGQTPTRARARIVKDPAMHELLKDLKVTVRCVPLAGPQEPGKCIFTGKPSTKRAIFAKAY